MVFRKNKYGRTFLMMLLLFMSACVCAQKKEIAQAKAFVKSGNNLTQAEEMMQKLLADSVNRTNHKIWLTLFEAVRKQYGQANEKFYLKQQSDTAQLFVSARKMFLVAERFDSVDALPDEKGRIVLKYRRKHAELLSLYRPNLFNGGLYFMQKHDYATAYDFFATYTDCRDQPLFSDFHYDDADSRLPQAASYAVFCGYKLQDADKTMRYVDLARRDTARLEMLYQYLAETYKAGGDTVAYVSMLREGVGRYTRSLYFFTHLFDYYTHHDDISQASTLCDKALSADSANVVFRYAKSSVLLSQGQYAACIAISDSLISADGSFADAYLNAGLAYFNQGAVIDNNARSTRQQRARMLEYYKKALPYLQHYRILAPDQKDRWGVPLYTIYLNLNMGKDFEEVDALLKDASK